MTIDDVIELIRSGLDDADHDKVPVVPPGTTITVLPAVVLAPSDDNLGDGNRTLRYGFNVTPIVPRNGQVAQYQLLVELEGIVVRSLIPTGIRFDGPLTFASTGGADTGEPPALSRLIPISFPSDTDLC